MERGTSRPSVERRTSNVERILVVAGFAALSIVLTYPQIRYLSSKIPAHYDALFSVWRLGWIAYQLPRDPLNLFDANIFHPATATLAYSDTLLLLGVVAAPFIWLGAHPVVVHNALTLLSFVASGGTMYVLARRLTGSRSAAWVAGLVFAFQPFRFAHFVHFELLWSCWIPLAFWAMHRAVESGRAKDGALVGLLVALQAWSCLYYGVFLVTALGVLSLVLVIGQERKRLRALAKPAAVAVLVGSALVGPYTLPYIESRRTVGTRSEGDVRAWSPTLRNYVATPPENWVYGRATGDIGGEEGTLFPGAIAIVLAFLGIRGGRRERLAYAVLCPIALDMSLGFNGVTYPLLWKTIWPYQGLRVPGRIFVIVSAALAVLAAYGVAYLEMLWPRARRALVTAIAVGVIIESLSIPVPLHERPPLPRVYAWLAEQPRSVVMEWPMPRFKALGTPDDPEPVYMYYSIFHWHRIVNGYSGFYPPGYIWFIEGVRNFPDDEALGYIMRRGVRYLLLHSEWAPKRYWTVKSALLVHKDFKLLVTAKDGTQEISVFRVRSLQSTHVE